MIDAGFVLAGLQPNTSLCLTLDTDHLQDAPGALSTDDGLFQAALLRPIPQIWHDPLSTFTFGEGRLKNLLYVAHRRADGRTTCSSSCRSCSRATSRCACSAARRACCRPTAAPRRPREATSSPSSISRARAVRARTRHRVVVRRDGRRARRRAGRVRERRRALAGERARAVRRRRAGARVARPPAEHRTRRPRGARARAE